MVLSYLDSNEKFFGGIPSYDKWETLERFVKELLVGKAYLIIKNH